MSVLYTTRNARPNRSRHLTLFVSRDALNMDGLSEATMEKFIAHGFIREFADIFHLEEHKDTIVAMDGFGEKSYQNMMDSIEAARKTTLERLLYGLGIRRHRCGQCEGFEQGISV